MIGVEISEKHRNINWKKVKKSKIEFVMLCCGTGGTHQIREDTEFWNNVKVCKEWEIPYGIYLCSRATDRKQAEMEAKYIRSVLCDQVPEYPVMLRMEDCNTTLLLNKDRMGEIAQIFCESVKQEGGRAGICANKYWFTNLLTSSEFNRWERWVIQHYKECTYSGTYTMWEYTSDGRLDGILEPVALLQYVSAFETGEKTEMVLPDLSGYVGTSLVGALNTKEYPSGFDFREKLAVQTNLVADASAYRGTAVQNTELLRRLGGTISASKMIREGSYVRLKPGSRNINTDMPFDNLVYGNTYQVLAVSGVSVIFGIEDTVIGKVNRNSVIVT